MTSRAGEAVAVGLDAVAARARRYVADNAWLIWLLAGVGLAAYGFELFSLNLTIDEEWHAVRDVAAREWISQGRWGMYVLNRVLLPYPIIPFVPLFVALAFTVAGTVVMLDGWRIEGRLERAVAGAVCLAFPGLAFVHASSFFNYGIGIGVFCASASLLVYSRTSGAKRVLAAVPAALALSIYQAFVPVLSCLYLVHVLLACRRGRRCDARDLLVIGGILAAAVAAYYAGHAVAMAAAGIGRTEYIGQFFDAGYLRDHLVPVVRRVGSRARAVYLGYESAYGSGLGAFAVLVGIALVLLAVDVVRSRSSAARKALTVALTLALLALPFAVGLLARGQVAMRWLTALPIAVAGVVALAMHAKPTSVRWLVAVVAGAYVFQSVVATNHLSGAAHLALQADRLLGSRVIERIEEAAADAEPGVTLRYLEVVGAHARPATRLVPKIDTIGYSFFEWDQGSAARILLFLKTIGHEGMAPLPLERRAALVAAAGAMPVWPERGSVRAVGDVAVLKFGPYSARQRDDICASERNRRVLQGRDFCR